MGPRTQRFTWSKAFQWNLLIFIAYRHLSTISGGTGRPAKRRYVLATATSSHRDHFWVLLTTYFEYPCFLLYFSATIPYCISPAICFHYFICSAQWTWFYVYPFQLEFTLRNSLCTWQGGKRFPLLSYRAEQNVRPTGPLAGWMLAEWALSMDSRVQSLYLPFCQHHSMDNFITPSMQCIWKYLSVCYERKKVTQT